MAQSIITTEDVLTGDFGEIFSLEPLGNGTEIYVSQNHTFGTDAVLLAHFANPKRSDRAVDLGTGCGIIPFIWLRDKAVASATGLEISPEGIALANASKIKNKNPDNYTFIEGDIKQPFENLKKGSYTLVTCNPPYKAAGAGIISESSADKKARHETACDLKDVVAAAAGLLQFGGRFAMCQRPERLGEIFSLMTEHKLEPKDFALFVKVRAKNLGLYL